MDLLHAKMSDLSFDDPMNNLKKLENDLDKENNNSRGYLFLSNDELPSSQDIFCQTLHLEVCLKPSCSEKVPEIEGHVHRLLRTFPKPQIVYLWQICLQGQGPDLCYSHMDHLVRNVKYMKLQDMAPDADVSQLLNTKNVVLYIVCHIFNLSEDGGESEHLTEGDGADEGTAAARVWTLPNSQFSSLWNSLFYDGDVKWSLVRYVETMILFSDKLVDQNIINYNRVVLLHGPPGTGKTSLCCALAHRLSVRLSRRFSYCQLVEINSHSLFSKWFSESGKLVMKMFEKIKSIYSDPNVLLFILIDEVESLAASRQAAAQGSEPSDALRVVNAMLTQLDQLRHQPNVVVLTTSNITGSVDVAFVDRADIKQLIGLPTAQANYSILHSCVNELTQRGIVNSKESLSPVYTYDVQTLGQKSPFKSGHGVSSEERLYEIAKECCGLSGRTLRKVPFLAIAMFLPQTPCTLAQFFEALNAAVAYNKKQVSALS